MTAERVASTEGHGLPIPDGPWMADVWLMPRVPRLAVSGDQECAVEGCSLPAGTPSGQRAKSKDVLCKGHQRRALKAPTPDLAAFIQQQATARPIGRPRGADTGMTYRPAIDFTRAHPRFVEQLRFVTALKISRSQWRNDEWANIVLRASLAVAEEQRLTSLAGLAALVDSFEATGSPELPNSLVLSARSMAKLFEMSSVEPLTGLVWHPRDYYRQPRDAAGKTPIYWSAVTCQWLRESLMEWGRTSIKSGSRGWSTIVNWARAGALLSRYMDETEPLEPSDLGRTAFIDFLSWVRTGDGTKQDLHAVNTMARLLEDLRIENIVADLPDVTLLRRGENPVPKVRAPKPFPADILKQIDDLTATDGALDADVRLLLRVFRAVCPRPSEALTLPLDCVEHGPRGYTLDYFQSKTQERRRVPLPDALGRDLVTQAEKVRREHPGCQFLFPFIGKSPRRNTLGVTLRQPSDFDAWSYGRFSETVWTAYQQHGIAVSSTTGEVLTGPQLHRFRHSVATGLLNEGWSQYMVQKFMGHTSPTMMQSYAEIHEDTLRSKYEEFVNHNVDVTGTHQVVDVSQAADEERIRDRMIRSALPNGYCTLPESQTCDFVPHPCLTCTPFFKTTPTFLPIHIRQRDESLRELELAQTEGRDRAADAHQRTVTALETIIAGLEAQEGTS